MRLDARIERRILRLRDRRWSAVRIGHELGIGHSSVQRVLKRHGRNQLPRPARVKAKRYEKQRPGELLHLDLKFLPALRNARNGFESAAVDDFSREAVVSIRTEQTSASAATFLELVVARLP
jgi:IS30 family transposase